MASTPKRNLTVGTVANNTVLRIKNNNSLTALLELKQATVSLEGR